MRQTGLVLFLLLSVVVHVAVAAHFVALPQAVQEERGVGATALEIGSLFNAASQSAAEPKEIKPVFEPKRLDRLDPLRQAVSVKTFTEIQVRPTEALMVDARPVTSLLPSSLAEDLVTNERLERPDILKPKAMSERVQKTVGQGKFAPQRQSNDVTVPMQAVQPTELVAAQQTQATPLMLNRLPRIKPVAMAQMKPVPPTPKSITAKTPRKTQKTAKKQSKASKGARKGGKSANKKGARNVVDGARGKKQKANGKAAVSNYKGKVTARIKRRMRYPSAARKRRELGMAVVRFQVTRSGAVQGIQLVKSSGSRAIDKAAQAAVRRAAPFPPLPSHVSHGRIGFTVPLGFRK